MKKLISIILTLAMLSSVTAIAADDEIKVVLDGERIEFDVQPIIENERTLVPMRAIFEAMDKKVTWFEDTKSAWAEDEKTLIYFWTDEEIQYITKSDIVETDAGRHLENSRHIEIDVPARVVNERTLVPLRAISEAFDCDVEWDGDTRTVTITSAELTATPQPTAVPTEVSQCTDEPSATRIPSTATGGKPVIYLYPETEQEVSVTLDLDGEFIFTYPEYNNGWTVTAKPDGTIISEGKEYSYLFWEGYMPSFKPDFKEGFVVKGSDSAEFLRETLSKMGLTPKEYNEFIVYWAPKMQENEYNKVYFAKEEYNNAARLNITPKPDSLLRVFMVYEATSADTVLPEQEIKPFERNGFTVVEWGGYLKK